MRSLLARPAAALVPEDLRAGSVVLAARAVRVLRAGRPVVDDVDLEVRAGEVLALVGPNGAGKSSLLSALSGDEAVHSGSVSLFERLVRAWSADEAARRRAVLLQEQLLAFPFRVRDVVAMGRAPWRLTAAADDDEAIVADSLQRLDVAQFADRSFNSLSGGERARVALARVLAQRTQLLLLDEPTAALDLHHQELVFDVVRSLARAGSAVVVVVHDLGLAAAHCDRIALLGAGRLHACGSPAEVLTSAQLSRTYGHEIEIVAHPRTGLPIVLPRR
ncbi:MAG: hmuV [Pseudonocardiales bacterium]|nr:hmuV [Pseudonocardiales bacterium]